MKSIGIVRKLDGLGRVVIPRETRRILKMKEGTPLEIYLDGERIILQKYSPGCMICGSMEGLSKDKANNKLCNECLGGFKEQEG